jgi:hypothetical protein
MKLPKMMIATIQKIELAITPAIIAPIAPKNPILNAVPAETVTCTTGRDPGAIPCSGALKPVSALGWPAGSAIAATGPDGCQLEPSHQRLRSSVHHLVPSHTCCLGSKASAFGPGALDSMAAIYTRSGLTNRCVTATAQRVSAP